MLVKYMIFRCLQLYNDGKLHDISRNNQSSIMSNIEHRKIANALD